MGRKIYLMNEESLVEFFKRPVRYLKENTSQKESAFEKPYLDESYRRMHFSFPNPDWPQIPPGGPFPPLPPLVPPEIPKEGVCAITCYEPLSDCDEPVWCHPSIWTGQDPDCTGCQWIVEGAFLSYSWHSTVGGEPRKTWGIDIEIDEDLVNEDGVALIKVQMQDIAGNLCGEEIEVTCKVCPPEVEISWDSDLSAETIGQGNGGDAQAGVYVTGGLGPYDWSVSGTGFSMLNASTDGVGNTLLADDTACGTATITVTDYCGDTTTGYVRCTADSHWENKSTDVCEISGSGTCEWNAVVGRYECELIVGNKRQRQNTKYDAGGCCWATEAQALSMCDQFGGDCRTSGDCNADDDVACVNCIDPDRTMGPGTGGCEIYPSGANYGYRNWCVGAYYYDEWECD